MKEPIDATVKLRITLPDAASVTEVQLATELCQYLNEIYTQVHSGEAVHSVEVVYEPSRKGSAAQ